MLPQHILAALFAGQQIEAVITLNDEYITWVSIIHLFQRGAGVKAGQAIKPNAKYVVKWVQMSMHLYQAYIEGNDITASDGEIVERELADNEKELQNILLQKLNNLDGLVLRSQNPVRLP